MSKINFDHLYEKIGQLPGVLRIMDLSKNGKKIRVTLAIGEKADDFDEMKTKIISMMPEGIEVKLNTSKKWDIMSRLKDPMSKACDETYVGKK